MAFLLTDKCELAFCAVLETANVPCVIVPGKAEAPKVLPIVICSAEGEGEEDPKGSGNFWYSVTTSVKHNAYDLQPTPDGQDPPDEKADNEAIITAAFQALQVDNLPKLLSDSTDDFFVWPSSCIVGSPQASKDESGIYIDSLTIRIYCCGTDLT